MSAFKKLILLGGDIAVLYLALIVTVFIRYGEVYERLKSHLGPFSLIFIIWLFVFYLNDLYRYKTFRNEKTLFKNIALSVAISGVISALVFYLFGEFFRLTPKTNLLIFSFVFLALDYFLRLATIKIFAAGGLRVAIFGDSPLIAEMISHLKANPHAGYQVPLWIKDLKANNFEELSKMFTEKNINLVVVQFNLIKDASAVNLIYRLLPLEVGLMNFFDFYELIFEKAPLDELKEDWFIQNVATRRPFYDAIKRIFEFTLSIVAALAFFVPAVIFGLLIKITSRGPAIYKQARIGKNSKVFTLYKFRTMYSINNGPLWTESKDNRVTPFGKFLRFTHLDEIPQIINILKGNISLIGPRPERVELAQKYQGLPYYEIRHIIKPGLTGWAQINFKPSASLEEAKEKLKYDIYYVKNRSFFLDFLIVLKTIKYFFASHRS